MDSFLENKEKCKTVKISTLPIREHNGIHLAMNMDLMVSQYTFVAFDFETTGLFPANDRIVEFGAVKFSNGKVIDTFQSLIHPERVIPQDSVDITGISNEMVKNAPKLEEILPKFIDFLEGAILLAHNADFDNSFLRASTQRLGIEHPKNLVIDTLALSKRAFTGLKSYSLQYLIEILKLPTNQAHRALDDSLSCMRIFDAACENLGFMGDISLKEVIA